MLQFDQLLTPVWIYDTVNSRIHWANQSALSLWQADSLEELTSRDFSVDASDAVQQTLLAYLKEFEKGRSFRYWWRLTPRGQVKEVYCQFSGIRLENGQMAMLVEGVEQNELIASPAFNGSAVVTLFDETGKLISASNYQRERFGSSIQTLGDLMVYPAQARLVIDIAFTQGYHQEDIKLQSRQGERWHSIELRRTRHNDQRMLAVTLHDIHERKTRELQLQQEARTDALTGTLNRNGLVLELQPLFDQTVTFTLFYIDLDGFKPINDSYGHGAGDELLIEVARRLDQQAGKAACVSRIGGDEFVVVITEAALEGQQLDAASYAEALLEAVSGSYRVTDIALPIQLSASIGYACYPLHDRDLALLLADADTAMYAAKHSGRRRCLRYQKGMREEFHRRTQISQQLHRALVDNQLRLSYQPVVNVNTGRLALIEALLRWEDERLGIVTASELIDAAEHSGLIGELSRWIYRNACQDFRQIQQHFGDQVLLSLNISAMHIMQGGFIPALEQALSESGLKPQDLVLELTERVVLPSTPEYGAVVPKLIQMGFGIAIDDFGTGFSSLAYLSRIPAHWVKLDREFVQVMEPDCATILSIHQMIERLGMDMIVEGVEYGWQAAQLQQAGIYLQQGYFHIEPQDLQSLIARAQNPDWFADLLASADRGSESENRLSPEKEA